MLTEAVQYKFSFFNTPFQQTFLDKAIKNYNSLQKVKINIPFYNFLESQFTIPLG